MDFEFDGALMYTGDTVYVVGKGPAKVIETKGVSYFRIKVGGRVRKVSPAGIQSGDSFKTVFWRNPIITIPSKNNALWHEQQKLALATTNAFAGAVKNQDLVELAEPESEVVSAQATNSAALQDMVERIQNGESITTVAGGGTVTDINDARQQ